MRFFKPLALAFLLASLLLPARPVSASAAPARAVHPQRAFEVAIPDGWEAVVDESHIDLRRDGVTIHVYPVFSTFSTIDDIYDNIAGYYSPRGAQMGEVRSAVLDNGSEFKWSSALAGEHLFIGGVIRDGQGFFARAWSSKAQVSDELQSVYVGILSNVRASTPAEIANIVENRNAISNYVLFDHALWTYAEAYGLVEQLYGTNRTLEGIGYELDASMWLDEAENPDVILSVLYSAESVLETERLTKFISNNLDTAIRNAERNRPASIIAGEIVVELETALKAAKKARTTLDTAWSECEYFFSEKNRNYLKPSFDSFGKTLVRLQDLIEYDLLPKAKSLGAKVKPLD